MTGRELIKTLMQETGITNAQMAATMNLSQATIWERLNNTKTRDIPLSTFCDMVDALNYTVVVLPKASSNLPDGARVVTVKEEAKVNKGGRKKHQTTPAPTMDVADLDELLK